MLEKSLLQSDCSFGPPQTEQLFRSSLKNYNYLWFKLPCKQQIPSDIIQGIDTVNRLLHSGMQIHDAPGNGVIYHLGYWSSVRITSQHQPKSKTTAPFFLPIPPAHL